MILNFESRARSTVSTTYCSKVLLLLAVFASSLSQVQAQDAKETKVVSPNQEKSAEAQRADNLPEDINRGFLDPNMDPEEYIKRFEVESREVFARRREIVESLEIKPGLGIADIGAGTGLFLKPLSIAAGEKGKLYAVDISPSFYKHLKKRVADEGLKNVEVTFCSDRDAKLPKGSVDRILVCDTYHHFEYPESTLRSIHTALRPGGMMVVVDFHREPENVSSERKQWLAGHVRAPLDVFRSEIEKAGFDFKDQVTVEGFVENYLIRFVKR
jgi:ubiquinone/menaquinone biosynthesis C-methylase UbiE